MDVHKNPRTTPHSRALIAQRVAAGERPAAVARAVGVCNRTVHKWVARAAEGPLALEDRSCRPRHSPRATTPKSIACAARPIERVCETSGAGRTSSRRPATR